MLSLFVGGGGGCVWSLFCNIVLSVLSRFSFANISLRKRALVALLYLLSYGPRREKICPLGKYGLKNANMSVF